MRTWILSFVLCGRLLLGVAGTDLDEYDFSGIEQQVEESGTEVSFSEIASALFAGEWREAVSLIGTALWNGMFSEVDEGRRMMLELIAIAAAGSVFVRFMELFDGGEIARTATYIMDMLFIALLFACFQSAASLAQRYLTQITEFMKALVPAYCTAIAVSGKIGTATVSSQLLLFAAALVEWICVRVLLPVIEVYLVLTFLNRLTGEELFENLRELLKTAVGWSMKALMGLLLGLQLVQGIVLPAADSGKYHIGERLIGLIPGLGSGAQVVINTAVGSGILIKNCIGGAGMLVIAVLTLIPCCKLALLAVGYQLTSAVMQPACDPSMAQMAAGTATAVGMLAKMVALGGFLFFLSLAAISTATGIAVTG